LPCLTAWSHIPHLGTLERELLLLCGRVHPGAEQATRIEELVGRTLDWDALVWHARLHSVAPLLHHHVARANGSGGIPASSRRKLLQLSHRAAYQNRFYAQEHAALVAMFDEAGIETITPKGLPLVELVYGSHAMRPLIDLLYLVPRPQLDTAARLLRERGYHQARRRAVDEIEGWVRPQVCLVDQREIRLAVVLFTELVAWPRLHRVRPDEVFARAERAVVGGTETAVLSPVDLILYLCLQADNHGYFNRVAHQSVEPVELLLARWSNNRLIRFTDLYESIRHWGDRIDWSRLIAYARSGGVEEPVYVSLVLTSALLGPLAPAAEAAAAELQSACRHRLRGWLFEAVTRRDGAETKRLKRFAGARWSASAAGRHLRLIHLLNMVELAFPDLRTLRARYPRVPMSAAAPIYAVHASGTIGASGARFVSHALRGLASRIRGELLSRSRR
jgi:hypothetical protein